MAVRTSAVEEIEEGQRLRGWIANAYAQIEFLLGDLTLRCRKFPEYKLETAKFSHSAPKRVRQVRAMVAKTGPLSPFSTEITSILDRFEERHTTRNLLAHGLCTYIFTPSGDTGLNFQKFERQPGRDDAKLVRTFTFSALKAEEASLVSLSHETMNLFVRMHKALGWASPLS